MREEPTTSNSYTCSKRGKEVKRQFFFGQKKINNKMELNFKN